MPTAQKLQLMIRKADAQAIINSKDFRGIRILINIDDTGAVGVMVDGVRFNGDDIIPTTTEFTVCPIPPDCN
jgi:hypothetical protein